MPRSILTIASYSSPRSGKVDAPESNRAVASRWPVEAITLQYRAKCCIAGCLLLIAGAVSQAQALELSGMPASRGGQPLQLAWAVAAVTETDYPGALSLEQLPRSRGEGLDFDQEHQVAWFILFWVWLCGAVVAALVFVTYRNLALREYRPDARSGLQGQSGQTSSTRNGLRSRSFDGEILRP